VEQMRAMPECSVDAVVCDPPYGLGFMGKEWDSSFAAADMPMRRNGAQDAVNAGASRQGGRQRAGVDYQRRMARDSRAFQDWCEAWAREALRVLKPGGHLLAFGGTRTYHRLACAVEDAGFEIRDTIAWMYGSGFPKSLNLPGGLGTALKPAHEPIVVARKPLSGTVAATVLEHGTGALNVDGCRIDTADDLNGGAYAKGGTERNDGWGMQRGQAGEYVAPAGRWPANVVMDPDAAAILDEQTGESTSPSGPVRQGGMTGYDPGVNGGSAPREGFGIGYGDSGGASRFFYCAKSSSAERNAGLDGFEEQVAGAMKANQDGSLNGHIVTARNVHPTVKPIELMRWLVRLVTPPGGLVLDPFTGSGTTGCAAALEGARFIGVEREPEYAAIARARIAWWAEHPDGMALVERLEHERNRQVQAEAGQLGLFG